MVPSHLRRLRFVPRWGVVPTIKQQNVAEHCFGVVWVLIWLHDQLQLAPSLLDIRYAVSHDALEAVTGDHPSPSKPEVNYINMPVQKKLVKIADLVEMEMTLNEETKLGNVALADVTIDIKMRLNKCVRATAQDEAFVSRFGSVYNAEEALFTALQVLFDSVAVTRHPCMEHYRGS